MQKVAGGVVINEVEAEPLSDYVLDFLIAQRKESPYLDFKKIIHVQKNSNFPEIAKDFFAFSNYGGGWILIGWDEVKSNTYIPVGLPDDYSVDQATLQEKFNSFSNVSIEIQYLEFNRDLRPAFNNSAYADEIKERVNSISNRFAAIFIPPSYELLKPTKDGKYEKDGKEKIVFVKDNIFYRRGTQSIPPNSNELNLIKKRIEKENYRLSVLSGAPDEIDEKIHSNLFPVTKLPKYVYSGEIFDYDSASIKFTLKRLGVFPEWMHKFKVWDGKLLTFEDLTDQNNVYRNLVLLETIKREPIENWLDSEDKNRIVVELLNREIRHHAIGIGMFHFKKRDKFYYDTDQEKRVESWQSRYGKATRTVATKMWAEQLHKFVYCHGAFFPNFLQLGKGNFYLRILPTFVITEDGEYAISGFKEGTIITRLSYDKYNSNYLNNVLFWIYKLGDGNDIQIGDYLTISSEPLTTELPLGIIFDIPSSEFKLEIEEESEEGFSSLEGEIIEGAEVE